MDSRSLSVLSLCAGVGGLDLGIRMAQPNARTVCFVEIEAFACEILATRMEDKTMDEAPIRFSHRLDPKRTLAIKSSRSCFIFWGRKIAAAFAITIASNFDFFEVYDLRVIFLLWIIIGILAAIILKIVAVITECIVLFRVSVMREILDNKNINIGAIHAAIYITIGILFMACNNFIK